MLLNRALARYSRPTDAAVASRSTAGDRVETFEAGVQPHALGDVPLIPQANRRLGFAAGNGVGQPVLAEGVALFHVARRDTEHGVVAPLPFGERVRTIEARDELVPPVQLEPIGDQELGADGGDAPGRRAHVLFAFTVHVRALPEEDRELPAQRHDVERRVRRRSVHACRQLRRESRLHDRLSGHRVDAGIGRSEAETTGRRLRPEQREAGARSLRGRAGSGRAPQAELEHQRPPLRLHRQQAAIATPVRQTVFRVNGFAVDVHGVGDRQPRARPPASVRPAVSVEAGLLKPGSVMAPKARATSRLDSCRHSIRAADPSGSSSAAVGGRCARRCRC